MGTNNSNLGANSKTGTSLAEKRYKVSGIKSRRRRKTGNVTTTGCDGVCVEQYPEVSNIPISTSLRSLTDPKNLPRNSATSLIDTNQIDQRLLALYPNQFSRNSLSNESIDSNHNPVNTILLTRTQRVLIENSWKRSRKIGSESVGARIFLAVLTTQPDIKIMFGLEKVHQGRLKYDPNFRKHASVLTRTLDYIVKNLAYTEKLTQHFNELGKKHCELPGRVIFKQQYWDSFAECMTQSVIEFESIAHRCRETTISWRNLIAFIIKQMRRGYEDEKLFRKRFTASLMNISYSRGSSLDTFAPTTTTTTTSTIRNCRGLNDCRNDSVDKNASMPLVIDNNNKNSTARKRTSSMNYYTENNRHRLVLPLLNNNNKKISINNYGNISSTNSIRSASWCSEQTTTSNLNRYKSNNEEENHSKYYNSSKFTTSYQQQPTKRCISMPSHDITTKNTTTTTTTTTKQQQDASTGVQLRIYNENGSLTSICEALANLGRRSAINKNRDNEKNLAKNSMDSDEIEMEIFHTPRSSTRRSTANFTNKSLTTTTSTNSNNLDIKIKPCYSNT